MKTSFWGSNPYILLNKNHILEFWPTQKMDYNQKLNAISRAVIILTMFGLLTNNRLKVLITGLITLGIIYLIQSNVFQKKEKYEEAFENYNKEKMKIISEEIKDQFTNPTIENPNMNILINEYKDNPTRPKAKPSYDKKVNQNIENKMKKQIQKLNPSQKNINDKLFIDLGDEVEFNGFMRNFYTMPNTENPNGQKEFAEFCNGNTSYDKDFYNTDFNVDDLDNLKK